MALTLVATSNGKASAPAAPGSDTHVLQVAAGDVVRLTATSDGESELGEVTWSVDGNRFTGSTPVETDDPKSKAIEIAIASAENHGTYAAASTSILGLPDTSNPVSLGKTGVVVAGDGETDDGAASPVTEIEVGEMDRPFALISLLVLGAFAGVIVFIAWRIVSRIALPASTVVADDAIVFGTWAERSASIVYIVALAGGLVILLVGAWLAAIETRGRLRIHTDVVAIDPKTGKRSSLDAQSADAIGGVLGKARRFRGAIAVVIAGVLIIGFAVWGASGF